MRASILSVLLLQGTAAIASRQPNDTAPPYLDPTVPAHERASDLLQRMTWEEKVGQLGGIRKVVDRKNGEPVFNRTSFEQIRETQNGQIG